MEGLFDFEQDGRYPLRRIPMRIRFNLDACGIRFSLTAWTLLSRDEREYLLNLPCGAEQQRQAYRDTLAAMLKPHAENPEARLEEIVVETMPAWQQVNLLPSFMIDHLTALALPIPTLEFWRDLSDLQRFTLIKLTRHGHRNTNLIPALKEFCLV